MKTIKQLIAGIVGCDLWLAFPLSSRRIGPNGAGQIAMEKSSASPRPKNGPPN